MVFNGIFREEKELPPKIQKIVDLYKRDQDASDKYRLYSIPINDSRTHRENRNIMERFSPWQKTEATKKFGERRIRFSNQVLVVTGRDILTDEEKHAYWCTKCDVAGFKTTSLKVAKYFRKQKIRNANAIVYVPKWGYHTGRGLERAIDVDEGTDRIHRRRLLIKLVLSEQHRQNMNGTVDRNLLSRCSIYNSVKAITLATKSAIMDAEIAITSLDPTESIIIKTLQELSQRNKEIAPPNLRITSKPTMPLTAGRSRDGQMIELCLSNLSPLSPFYPVILNKLRSKEGADIPEAKSKKKCAPTHSFYSSTAAICGHNGMGWNLGKRRNRVQPLASSFMR